MKKLLGCSYILALAMCFWALQARTEPLAATSKISLNGKFAIKQLVSPGFAELPLERRIFASHLADAIEAGRDIAWHQQGEYGLPIRLLFEQIWRKADLAGAELKALEHYYFRVLSSHGVYDRTTNSKFVLEAMDQPRFLRLLARLKIPAPQPVVLRAMFDKEFKKYAIAPRGEDLVADSGVDFYGAGMSQARYDQMSEDERQNFFSYPVWDAKAGRAIVRLHRVGGRFHEDLLRVDRSLEKAEAYANPVEKKILALYRKVIRSGDPKDQDEAERAWVQNKTPDLVFHLGFTETYDDPLQQRGTWEGFIMLLSKDAESERRAARIRESATDFEQRMPVDPEFIKRGDFTPPNSESAHILFMGGGSNEVGFSGVNLPNDNLIRATLGSRSFTAINKVTDIGKVPGEDYLPGELEAFYLPGYHPQMREFGQSFPYTVQVEFHEVLGHGSGKPRDGVDPKALLGSFYAAMEEARAELGAFYHALDFETVTKHKILPLDWTPEKRRAFAETQVLQFFTKHLISLEKLNDAPEIRQAHQLGRHMIFNEMMNKGALKISISEEGVPRVMLSDVATLRRALGEIWRQVQFLKSTGDGPRLLLFTQRLGSFTDEQRQWAKSIKAAFNKIERSEYTVYLSPRLRRVTASDGQIIDVVQDYLPSGGDLSKLFDFEQTRECENSLL